MSPGLIKEAFELAEKEFKEKKIDEVKRIVLKTLERIDELVKEKGALEEKIKILRMDIDDLKEGKLDRIVERQEKDEKAKNTSVVVIIKEKEVIREVSPWYWPYRIYWNPAPVVQPLITWGSGTEITSANSLDVPCTLTDGKALGITDAQIASCSYLSEQRIIDCSTAKDYTIGTYEVGEKIVHLR